MRISSSISQAGFADILVLFGTLITSTIATTFASPPQGLLEPIPKQALMQMDIQQEISTNTSVVAATSEQTMGLSEEKVQHAMSESTLLVQTDISPTPSTSVTNTPAPSATSKPPAPTAIPTHTATPTHVPATPTISTPPASLISTSPPPAPAHSLNSDLILSLINTHRKNMGLPALEKEDRLCALAQSRGPELYDEIFVTHTVHAGFYKRNLPYWITENMASYGSEEAVVSWWLGSYIHRKAIEANYKYSCGTCFGTSCNQLFTNYTPK